MELKEIFSILRIVFDFLLLVLILLVVGEPFSIADFLSIDLMRLAFVTTVIGIVGYIPTLASNHRETKNNSGGAR